VGDCYSKSDVTHSIALWRRSVPIKSVALAFLWCLQTSFTLQHGTHQYLRCSNIDTRNKIWNNMIDSWKYSSSLHMESKLNNSKLIKYNCFTNIVTSLSCLKACDLYRKLAPNPRAMQWIERTLKLSADMEVVAKSLCKYISDACC